MSLADKIARVAISRLSPHQRFRLTSDVVRDLPLEQRAQIGSQSIGAIRRLASVPEYTAQHQAASCAIALMLEAERVPPVLIAQYVNVFDSFVFALADLAEGEQTDARKVAVSTAFLPSASIETPSGVRRLEYDTHKSLKDVFESGKGNCSAYTTFFNLGLYAIGVNAGLAVGNRLHLSTAIEDGSLRLFDASNSILNRVPITADYPIDSKQFWIVRYPDESTIKGAMYAHAVSRALAAQSDYAAACAYIADAFKLSPGTNEAILVDSLFKAELNISELKRVADAGNDAEIKEAAGRVFQDYLHMIALSINTFPTDLQTEFLSIQKHVGIYVKLFAEGNPHLQQTIAAAESAAHRLREFRVR